MTDGADLPRGGNISFAERNVRVMVSWRGGDSVDACALLLTTDGKVRDDADFVFYNEPEHGSGSARLVDGGDRSAVVSVDVAAVPAR